MNEKPSYVTSREFSQYQKGMDNQLSDIKVMLVRLDSKLDRLRTETIPKMQTQQATLTLKSKVLYGLLSLLTGGAGAAVLQGLSGLLG